jgi:hypothetical protein
MAKRKPKAEATPEPAPIVHPDPAERLREGATGIEVTMGDGRTWLLAHCGLAKGLTAVRDRMFDSLIVYDEASGEDILEGCFYALRINYNLTDEEFAALVNATDPATIFDGVIEAVLPTACGDDRTYTGWARASLLANGIKPIDVPAGDMRNVLDMLVATNRTLPLNKFVESARHAAARATIRGMIPRKPAEVQAMQATD